MDKVKIFIFTAILFCSCGFTVLAENANNSDTVSKTNVENQQSKIPDNTRTSLYLHPVSLIGGLGADPMLFLLYATVEVPKSLSNSLIIKPSLWFVPNSNYSSDLNASIRFGSDFGIRHFPNANGDGFYIQGQSGLFYISNNSDVSVWFDIMGYAGFSKKYAGLRFFIDAGIGLGFVDDRTFLFDINFGIGFPFLQDKRR